MTKPRSNNSRAFRANRRWHVPKNSDHAPGCLLRTRFPAATARLHPANWLFCLPKRVPSPSRSKPTCAKAHPASNHPGCALPKTVPDTTQSPANGDVSALASELHLRQQFHQDVAEKLCRKDAQPLRYRLLGTIVGCAQKMPRRFSSRIASITEPICRQIRLKQMPPSPATSISAGAIPLPDTRHSASTRSATPIAPARFQFLPLVFPQRLFAPIFLDRSRMPHAAAFSFFLRFFAHGVSLPHELNFSNLDSLLRCLTCY